MKAYGIILVLALMGSGCGSSDPDGQTAACDGCVDGGNCFSGDAAAACGAGGATCDACTASESCQAGICTEQGANCAGCLDSGEICQAGNSLAACGQGGGVCDACDASEICGDGGCVLRPACGPANCATCCDGPTCVLPATLGNDACGTGGAICQVCTGGAVCGADNSCAPVCGPDTCDTCCKDGVCVAVSEDITCGESGGVCDLCAASESCSGGSCIPSDCCTGGLGCCEQNGTTCRLGTDASFCGASGGTCMDCGPNRNCNTTGACIVDQDALWLVKVRSAEIPATEYDGTEWDDAETPDNAPDVYVRLLAGKDAAEVSGESETITNDHTPLWAVIDPAVLDGVSARLLHSRFTVQVFDADPALNPDDPVGSCDFTLTDDDFSSDLVTMSCASTAETAGFTIGFIISPKP